MDRVVATPAPARPSATPASKLVSRTEVASEGLPPVTPGNWDAAAAAAVSRGSESAAADTVPEEDEDDEKGGSDAEAEKEDEPGSPVAQPEAPSVSGPAVRRRKK